MGPSTLLVNKASSLGKGATSYSPRVDLAKRLSSPSLSQTESLSCFLIKRAFWWHLLVCGAANQVHTTNEVTSGGALIGELREGGA